MFKSIKEWFKKFKKKEKKKAPAPSNSVQYTKNDAKCDASIVMLDVATSVPIPSSNKASTVHGGNFGGGGASGSWDTDKVPTPKPEPVPTPTPAVFPESTNLYSSSSYTSTIQGTTPSSESSILDSIGDIISEVASSIGDAL